MCLLDAFAASVTVKARRLLVIGTRSPTLLRGPIFIASVRVLDPCRRLRRNPRTGIMWAYVPTHRLFCRIKVECRQVCTRLVGIALLAGFNSGGKRHSFFVANARCCHFNMRSLAAQLTRNVSLIAG